MRYGEGRDAGIEGGICIWHATRVAQLIDDLRMRSVTAGTFEVRLRGVQPNDRATPVRPDMTPVPQPTSSTRSPALAPTKSRNGPAIRRLHRAIKCS